MRVILAVLLLAIPVAWLGLRASPEEPSPRGTAQARSHPVPSSAMPGPRAMAEEEMSEDGEAASEGRAAEEEPLGEHELEGPGPCIELVVTAQGRPVSNAKVAAARYEADDAIIDLTPLSVGPEGRRQAWCQPGEYLLVASAPGFAPEKLQLTVSAGSTPVARFELSAGHTLIGRVLDKDSEQPIAAAQLLLTDLDDDFGLIVPDISITSDARGLFRVDSLAAGTYQIEAEAPGHTGKTTEIAIPRPEGLSIELEGTCRLEGQVIDGAGAPVPGAEVWVLFHGRYSGVEEPDRADAQGRFSLEVKEGTYQLGASAGGLSGLHEGEVTVVRGGLVDGLVIRLHPTGSLTGKVFVQASHEPIEGARLLIHHAGSGWSHRARTDEEGVFRADQLVPGTYSITIFRSGFPMTHREGLLVQAGQETSVEFALARQASVSGRLTDALGRPAEEAYVLAHPAAPEPRNKPLRHSASADETGQYHLEDLPPGSYRLEARLTLGSQPVVRELTLQEGEEALADFVLPEALGRVEGSVQRASGGPPIHPVVVEAALGGSGTTGADVDDTGHFTLELLPGSYTLTAMYSDTHEPGPGVRVTVEAGKDSRVSLTVPDTLTETSGVVLNARGEPVPDASVHLDDGETLYASATDAGGRFTLRTSLDSAGKAASLHARNGPEEGEVQNVRLGSQGVVVRLRKAGALRGRISAARGPPVRGFELQVERLGEGASPPDRWDSRPFTGDMFELVDLPAGTLELRVHTSDGRSGKAAVRITPGQTASVELSVGGLASVTGRLVDTGSGAPIASWVNTDPGTPGAQALHTGQEGRFRFFGLEPGAHILEVGSQRRLSFQLREGEALELGDLDPATMPKAP